jgi:hypothetical protein
MPAPRRPRKFNTPLDDRQRKLNEEQEKLSLMEQKLKSVIEQAPRLKEDRLRARRDELLADRSSRVVHRLNSTTLADRRFELGDRPISRVRRRPMKAERRQIMFIFCALVVLLGIAVVWLLNVWHLQWPG